ncbi:Transcription factor spt8, partial [Spiromyces aspiralis]
GNIALWTVRHDEGRQIALLKGHTSPVSVLKVTPDEFGAVSGSWDKTIKVRAASNFGGNAMYWDLNTGQAVRTFDKHISQISAISFRPDWRDSEPPMSLDPDQGPADGADTAGGRPVPIMLSTSIDGKCIIWDVRDPTPIPRDFGIPHKTPPWALSNTWNVTGDRIYVGRRNNTIDEYDFASGNLVQSLRLPINSGPVSALHIMPNNRHLICCSLDNIRMWDLQKPQEKKGSVPFQIVSGHHGGTISQIFIDPSQRFMVSASGNRGWDGPSNKN